MRIADAIKWFKETFSVELQNVTASTPFDPDLLCAIAYQETGFIWSNLINKVPLSDIAFLCVGDTIDGSGGRKAFPTSKQDLLTAANGAAMFDIARDCLVQMAKFINGYTGAVNNPNKFCHGFGIFQYDLQHFKNDPDYFLQKKWADPKNTFLHCIDELFDAKERQGWKSKTTLTDTEKVFVAIAYNKGRADLAAGFKQGHKSSDGRFYGENIFDYMNIAKSATVRGSVPGPAPIPPPTPVALAKKIYRVKITSNTLNLRSEPKIPVSNTLSNRVAALPNGHLVGLISGSSGDKWFEVETSLNGANLRGFAASEFLELVSTKAMTRSIPVAAPFAEQPLSGITAVLMPQRSDVIIKRTGPAGPFSLNEPGQPLRSNSNDPSVLREEIMKIIDWLNVEKQTHKRYQPGEGKTFCNIYAHDFCHLAGVYLPRVWWTQRAIEKLARNEAVPPLLGSTIEEIRANSIFGWLRDFGERFGWRQTGELTKLQNAANLGGIGLIIAKRIDEGRSGHVTIVVPELDNLKAKRNENGEVVAPLQSQAGAVNFKIGTGKKDWWLGTQFQDHAFWIHA
jgi:hypothetical protein